MLASISKLIAGWSGLPVSLIGRINILQIKILPKLLDLFQNIPLPPPSDFFPRMKTIFINFIWNNNHPRLRLSLLYPPHDRVGALICCVALGSTAKNVYVLLHHRQTLDMKGYRIILPKSPIPRLSILRCT